MTVSEAISSQMHKLENVKSHPNMKDFFDTVSLLEKLDEEINKFPDKKESAAVKLKKKAYDMIVKMEENQEKIALRTKTQVEFDAIYDCIRHLKGYFKPAGK